MPKKTRTGARRPAVPPALDFTRHYRYQELAEVLRSLANAYPQLLTVESIGKSLEGRELWLATVTNSATGLHSEKPAYWIDGNTHAGEVTGSATALYTINYLLSHYQKDAEIRTLLDEQTFYILPRISVDGVEIYLTTPETLRSTPFMWPYPEERDGLQPQDVDGDGEILLMRVKDPAGEWKVSDKDPRLMQRRGVDEFGGTYYRLFREGLFKNFDGLVKVPTYKYGLDMNRQYPAFWAQEYQQVGAGSYPLSQPEARAVVDAIAARRNIAGMQSYHTFSGVILRPYAAQADEKMPKVDLEVFKLLGERGQKLTRYPSMSVYHGFRYDPRTVLAGGFIDWAYEHFGAFAFTTELWSMPERAGVEIKDFIAWYQDHAEEDDLRILAWNDKELGGEGFVLWKPFPHPQLGPVEIGGWKFKYTWQNPPPRLLEEECHRNMLFTLACAKVAPLLRLKEAKRERLAADLYKLTVTIENRGYLPTNGSQRALDNKTARPVEVELELPKGVELLIGKQKTEVGQLGGRTGPIGTWVMFYGGRDKDSEARLEYLVRGKGAVKITARSERGGTVHTEI